MWKWIIILFCLFLPSCSSIPCKVNIQINNNSNEDAEIEIINTDVNLYYQLTSNDYIKISNEDLKITNGSILIKTNERLKYLSFGEYDHWFPTTHNLIFNIDNNIDFINDRMQIHLLADNYEEYRKLFE